MTNYARKLANEALLSEKERKYLMGKIMFDRRDKSKFQKSLTLRYQNLVKDLRIIQDDGQKKKILDNWKLKNSFTFQYYFLDNVFWKSFGKWKEIPERIYPSKIHREIKGKRKISFYWIEEKKIDNVSANELEKALNPEHLFTKIKRVKISNEEKIDLIKGYEEGVIPTSKKYAITRKEIKRRISEKFSPITKEGKRRIITEAEKDPRNKKILETTRYKKFLALYKKLDKLVEPYESKFIIQPVLHPVNSKKEKYYDE